MTENYQVQPDEKLFRWLHPSQFVWEEQRPTSSGFSNEYLSVDIAELTNVKESYERAKKNGKNAVVSFEAKLALDMNQKIYHCPIHICQETSEPVCAVDNGCSAYKDDAVSRKLNCTNPAHGCVIGKKTKAVKTKFAKSCKVEIFPPQKE